MAKILEIREKQIKEQTLKLKTEIGRLFKLMEKYVDTLEEEVGRELTEEDKLKFHYIIKANEQCAALSDTVAILNSF